MDQPNVKAFVTQGGIQSIEEAIRAKVPMLCMPFGGDQLLNADRVHDLKIGRKLNLNELATDNLSKILQDLIENPM